MTLPRGLAKLSPREAHKSGRRAGSTAPACLSCGRTMQHTENNPTLTQTTGIALLRVRPLPSWYDRGIRRVDPPPDLRDAFQAAASSYDRRHTNVS